VDAHAKGSGHLPPERAAVVKEPQKASFLEWEGHYQAVQADRGGGIRILAIKQVLQWSPEPLHDLFRRAFGQYQTAAVIINHGLLSVKHFLAKI
jgi:hypothetical protein